MADIVTTEPGWTHHRARVAALSRDRAPDDPDLKAARLALQSARVEESIAKALADAPPLTPAQIDRLTGLLRGGSR